jgi:N-methylhydantoinase B
MTIAAGQLEVLWSRLTAAADEQAAALVRTSFTPIVRDSGDLSAAVFDTRGWMVAQAVTGTPGHINSLAASMRHFLAGFPNPAPGDVLITNDPWLSSGQLNDFTVVTPVFSRQRLVGFVGSTCHAIDIGGRGLSADGREVYEEGLRVPPTYMYRQGAPNEELFRLIEANVRMPKLVMGDLHAQVVGNDIGAKSVAELVEEFRLGDLVALTDEVTARSERRMRQAIAELPDGTYTSEVTTDGIDEPIGIRCAVTIDGSDVMVDYTGSSPQSRFGINVVLNYTAAYTTYGLKCVLAPDVPHNEGTFRPLTIWAPEGSVLNARFPAAVAGRHVVGQFLPFAVMDALGPVAPHAVMAQGSGNVWLTTVRGKYEEEDFVTVFFASGGTGARPSGDGLSATSFPSGIATTPVEVIETSSPVVIEEKALIPDSGGEGQFRGGLGQRIRLSVRGDQGWVVSCLADRVSHPASGIAGGSPGASGGFSVSDGRQPDPKLSTYVPPGNSVVLTLPGGGGFGSSSDRPRGLLERDLLDGRITMRDIADEG